MKNIYKFILLILTGILFISLIFFIPKEEGRPEVKIPEKPDNKLENTVTQPEIIEPNKEVIVSLEEDNKNQVLIEDKEILFISKSLQPMFVIEKNKAIQDIKIYFDESEEDLRTSRFSNAEIYEDNEKEIRFGFPYTLNHESHSLKIDYRFMDKEISEEYNFILVFYDDFSVSLDESKSWGMTKEAKTCYNNWKIEDGKLQTKKLVFNEDKDCEKSSLFFIRKLRGDFFIQYDLTPKSETVVLNSYLLERGLNFFFGDGTNKDIVLKAGKVLAKNNFVFEQDRTYRIRITRAENVYKVFVSDDEKISDDNLLISYLDENHKTASFDSSGFTVYKNSGELEIDNFYSSNEDISNIFNSDEEE